MTFYGLKNNHPWLADYKKNGNKKLRFEWIDTEKIDSIIYQYVGYGKYDTLKLTKYAINRYSYPRYKKTSTGSIVYFALNYSPNGQFDPTQIKYQISFTNNHQVKKIISYKPSEYNMYTLKNWYKESVFIDNCCYSHEGDTIYTIRKEDEWENMLPDTDVIPVSYEEGIFPPYYDEGHREIRIKKHNYKNNLYVWNRKIIPPFEVTDDIRCSFTLLDKTTNIWEYKCKVTFYDGTVKNFVFKINIKNGYLVENKPI